MGIFNMKTEGKNHGRLEDGPPVTAPAPRIPAALRNTTIELGSLPSAEAFARYGCWKMRALKDCYLGYGRHIAANDVFSIPGNLAWNMAMSGDAEFMDLKLEREAQLLKELEQLGVNKPENYQEHEAFRPPPEPRKKPFVNIE